MKEISFETFQTLAETGKYTRIPLTKELLSDMTTPIHLVRTLQAHPPKRLSRWKIGRYLSIRWQVQESDDERSNSKNCR